eukprot:scaffold2946_cov278-Chaetoceros_neogracile.AAC.23
MTEVWYKQVLEKQTGWATILDIGIGTAGLNVRDTVSSKKETAEESGNDTDPTSNDDGTAEEDGKDVTDEKVIGTVSGNDESAEESSNDFNLP